MNTFINCNTLTANMFHLNLHLYSGSCGGQINLVHVTLDKLISPWHKKLDKKFEKNLLKFDNIYIMPACFSV